MIFTFLGNNVYDLTVNNKPIFNIRRMIISSCTMLKTLLLLVTIFLGCEYVEAANLTSVRLSVAQITIGQGDVVQAVCSADLPSSNVFWKFNFTVVTDNSRDTVYQNESDGRSVLHFANAVLTDEGTYTCFAENQAGNFGKTLHRDFQLNVPSSPEFVTVEPEACSPKITVRWKPNSRALNIPHWFVLRNPRYKSEKYVFLQSRKTIADETFSVDVREWMFYSVSVRPCPSGVCTNKNSKFNRTSSPTVGKPGRASYLKVVLNKYSCLFKWRGPNDDTTKYISNYKVIIRKRPDYPQGLIAVESTKIVDKYRKRYFTEKKANMRYDLGIRAETCAGVGEIVWSNESCVTDRKAPEKVAKPELSANTFTDGTVELTIDIPSQEDGPISCLFVIVKVHETGDNVFVKEHSRKYTMDDLIRTNNLTGTTEYIALAFGIKGLYGNNKVTLGDERITLCEVSPALKRIKRSVSRNVFVGRNLKLDSSKNNSVYIMVSLSNYGEILLAPSESVVIPPTNQKPGDSKNILWIIGAIVGSITLLLLISIGVYVKKKAQSSTSSGAVVQGKAATTRFDGNIQLDEKAEGYGVIHQRTVKAKSKASRKHNADPLYAESIPHHPSFKNSANRHAAMANPTDQTNAETSPYVLQLDERPAGYDAIDVTARQDQTQNVYFKIAESDYEAIHVTKDAYP